MSVVVGSLCYRRSGNVVGVESLKTVDDTTLWYTFHERYEFCAIDRGTGDATYRARTVDIPEHTFCMLEPGNMRKVLRNNSTSCHVVIVEPDALQRLLPDGASLDGFHFRREMVRVSDEFRDLHRQVHELLCQDSEQVEIANQ